ncbi:hypothetical protein KY345_01170 [Candidatus Woesearchaeota archaeon]|nr:hypothetical protein [Candidatus Woesearchaeota archaeon]
MIKIIRVNSKPPHKELESLIAREAENVSEVRNTLIMPVQYDILEEQPDFDPSSSSIAVYDSDKDILYQSGNMSNHQTGINVFHELFHKSQFDLRKSKNIDSKPNATDFYRLIEGDAYFHAFKRHMQMHNINPSADVIEVYNLMIFKGTPSFFRSVIGFIIDACRRFPEERSRFSRKGENGRLIASGVSYIYNLDNMAGIDLINFALTYNHGDKLRPPHELYEKFIESRK